jgi:hypothetical protein
MACPVRSKAVLAKVSCVRSVVRLVASASRARGAGGFGVAHGSRERGAEIAVRHHCQMGEPIAVGDAPPFQACREPRTWRKGPARITVRRKARVQVSSSRSSGGASVVGARHNTSIERTSKKLLRSFSAAAHVER